MTDEKTPKAFLSHSSLDKPFVRELDRALGAYGIETFLDERDIGIGEDIPNRIYREIQTATHICYVISSNSINSEWVKDELSKASMLEKERSGIFVLPILIESVEIPVSLINRRYADFTLELERSLHERTAFRLLLKSMSIDPARFEPQLFPDSQTLLDLAETSAKLIRELISIRIRAQQLSKEWPDRQTRPDLNLLYERLLGNCRRFSLDVETYQEVAQRLRPCLNETVAGKSIVDLGEHLALFLDSMAKLPTDPIHLTGMRTAMDSLASESNVTETWISYLLAAILYFGRTTEADTFPG